MNLLGISLTLFC